MAMKDVDQVAALVLVQLCQHVWDKKEDCAKTAYEYADALMAEREARRERERAAYLAERAEEEEARLGEDDGLGGINAL